MNDPGGAVEVSGVPATYTPGDTYPVTITLTREGMRRGGFEIAARFGSGRQRGKQAGTWQIRDARAQLIPGAVDKALTFVQHNLAGSRTATRGTNTWTIDWTAPAATAPVQFNIAANASNNDDSPLGDYIYLKTVRSMPARR